MGASYPVLATTGGEGIPELLSLLALGFATFCLIGAAVASVLAVSQHRRRTGQGKTGCLVATAIGLLIISLVIVWGLWRLWTPELLPD